jgi:peptide/nickel transport system permease protein
MNMSPRKRVAAAWLALIHLIALLAGVLAPYDPTEQHRDYPFHPPTVSAANTAGAPGFVLGSDDYGRDQFSRLLFGLRVSLASGATAAALTLCLGALAGIAAGWAGGWIDALFMRFTELFISLPWLYLLLATRAFLPLDVSPSHAFLLFVALAGFIGWARPARLVRGVVLSGKEREFVQVARALGGRPGYLLRTHVLPQVSPLLRTQAAVLIPKYILAESTLSFLGLGISEPAPSLGGLLVNLQHYHVLASYWWMCLPAILLITIFAAWHALTQP